MNQTTQLDKHYQETYNQESAIYDEHRFGGLNNSFACRYKNKIIIDLLRKNGITNSDQRIADIPAGTGRITHELLRQLDCRVTAVDISSGMLAKNQQIVEENDLGSGRIDFTTANMKELPFEDASFDAVTMASFFYLVPQADYADYLADVVRVLKPNGIVIAEFSNGGAMFNPLTQVKIFYHRNIKRKKVKSYPYVWQLSQPWPDLKKEVHFGSEYPRLTKNYERYEKYCNWFGKFPMLRSMGGKFTVLFRKSN